MTELKVTPAMYREFVAGLFYRNEGDLSKDFAHAVLGISSEAFEIARASDAVNVFQNGKKAVMFVNLGKDRPAFEKAWDDSAKSVYGAVEDRLSKIVAKYELEVQEKKKKEK